MTVNSVSTTFGTNFANDAILDEFYQSRTPLTMFFKIGLRPFIFAEIFVAKLANVIFVGIWFDVIFSEQRAIKQTKQRFIATLTHTAISHSITKLSNPTNN